jgi:hypothetical protein
MRQMPAVNLAHLAARAFPGMLALQAARAAWHSNASLRSTCTPLTAPRMRAVFHAGPSQNMNWFTTAGAGGRRVGGTRPGGDQMNGNAVMYDAGKILTLGGAAAYELSDGKAVASVITLSGKTASAVATGSMAFVRAFCTSVAMPDGKVLTIGGQPYPVPFSDTDAVLPAGALRSSTCSRDDEQLLVCCKCAAKASWAYATEPQAWHQQPCVALLKEPIHA